MIFLNGVILLLEPKRHEEVGRMADPKYYWYLRMVNYPLEKYLTLKEQIMQLAKVRMIILNLDNVVETNYVSCKIKGLSTIPFGSLELATLYKHGLPNTAMQEGFFTISVFDKLTVNNNLVF